MIVADASFIITLRDQDDEHHAEAVAISDATAWEDLRLHPVTMAECLVGPARLGVVEEAATALRSAYEITEVDPDAPVRWAVLRAGAGLRLPDTIVLDTALTLGATSVVTFDEKLAAAATARRIDVKGGGDSSG